MGNTNLIRVEEVGQGENSHKVNILKIELNHPFNLWGLGINTFDSLY